MAKKPKKMGRGQPVIIWEEIDELLRAHLNGEQIAAMKGFHPDTLYDRCQKEKGTTFTAYAQKMKQGGKGNILYTQYKSALRGNNQMLILLGKEWLGQGQQGESPVSDELQIIHEMAAKSIPGTVEQQMVEAEQFILRQERPQESSVPPKLGSDGATE